MNQEIERLQKVIKEAKDEIRVIRAECTHPTTQIGMYEWRTGSQLKAVICTECGEMLKAIGQ